MNLHKCVDNFHLNKLNLKIDTQGCYRAICCHLCETFTKAQRAYRQPEGYRKRSVHDAFTKITQLDKQTHVRNHIKLRKQYTYLAKKDIRNQNEIPTPH